MRSYKRLSVLLIFALVFTLLLAVCLIACNSTALTNLLPSQKATTYVSLDVNPSIEIVLDQYNAVMSVEGVNEDARVLLFQEDGIVGADVNVAIENIASLAVKYNYITSDNASVDVCVVSCDEKTEEKISSRVSEYFQKGVQSVDSSIALKFESGINLELSLELENVKAQFADNKAVQDMTVSEFRLVKRALEADDTLTLEGALAESKDSLIAKVQRLQSSVEAKYDALYAETINKAEAVYKNAVNSLEGGLYVAHFAGKTTSSYIRFDYGAVAENLAKTKQAVKYAAANAYLASLQCYKALYRSYAKNPTCEISIKEANEIALSLCIEYDDFIAEIGASVSITKVRFEKSALCDCVNKLYRNASGEERTQISDAFGKISSDVFADIEIDSTVLDFSVDDVEETINKIKTHLAGNDVFVGIADSATSECKPDVDYSDETSINNAIALLKQKANEAYEGMALTDDDIEQIDEAKSQISVQLDSALKAYNDIKDTALNQALARMQSLKQSVQTALR